MITQLTYEYYKELDSTNDRIKERASQKEKEGLVISTNFQSSGRGRRGRTWEHSMNDNIASSLLIRPKEIPASSVSMITLIAGMAVRDALEQKCGLSAQIKWPNDIVVNKKKLSGILVEMSIKGDYVDYAVVGIGVNVHNKVFPKALEEKSTSVDLELMKLGKKDVITSRREIISCIWENFRNDYNEFLQTGDLRRFKDKYEKHLVNKGQRIRVENPKSAYEATAVGIDEQGALVIDVDGQLKKVKSEEVSVRGIYGYV